MSAVSEILEVARRDFVQRARSKAFLITTALTVGLILVMAPVLGSALSEADQTNVGTVGVIDDSLLQAIRTEGERVGLDIRLSTFDTVADAEAALERDEVTAVVSGAESIWLDGTDLRLQTALDAARQQLSRAEAIAELGLTAEDAARIVAPSGWETRLLEPEDPAELPRAIVAQIGGFLLYMGIIIFGQFVLTGVMEEKQNRVVEVILSRIPATRLLAGKILGIGALGLVQMVLLGGAILLGATQLELPDIDLGSVGVNVFVLIVVWYLLGFGLYAVLYGAMGATVSRQEDAQGAVMIPTLVLVAAYFVATFSAENPDGLLAMIGSMFPLTAPVVMPFRAVATAVPWWQMLTAAGLVALTTAGMVRLGARVYSGAVLSLGKRVRLRDAWRSSDVATGR